MPFTENFIGSVSEKDKSGTSTRMSFSAIYARGHGFLVLEMEHQVMVWRQRLKPCTPQSVARGKENI